jgi:hypothetical protein
MQSVCVDIKITSRDSLFCECKMGKGSRDYRLRCGKLIYLLSSAAQEHSSEVVCFEGTSEILIVMVIGESVAITVVVTGRVTEAVVVVLWSFQISRDTRIRNLSLPQLARCRQR